MGSQAELGVKGVEPEEITMGADGRARPPVTCLFKTVDSLDCSIWELSASGHVLGEAARIGGYVPNHPVGKSPTRCIGVFN